MSEQSNRSTHDTAYRAGQTTRGFVGEIATGMSGFIWTITHPGKSFLRTVGVIGIWSGTAAIIGGVAYLLAGQPGTSQFDLWRPATWGASAVDAIRPGINTGQQLIRMQLNEVQPGEAGQPADEPGYRR
ncbi:hypothetical protein NDI45_24280 [Leptolyngbya sp. GB1-A1]|uniref:hypothetical protein n=1 Tax=Leptolyngbya sp. GB1-A1 TaxID=2933908 RepID=UPI003299F39D